MKSKEVLIWFAHFTGKDFPTLVCIGEHIKTHQWSIGFNISLDWARFIKSQSGRRRPSPFIKYGWRSHSWQPNRFLVPRLHQRGFTDLLNPRTAVASIWGIRWTQAIKAQPPPSSSSIAESDCWNDFIISGVISKSLRFMTASTLSSFIWWSVGHKSIICSGL